MIAILIIAWAFALIAFALTYRYVARLGEDIDAPVPLALYRERCDEVARLQARVRLLEAQLSAVESNP